VKLTASFEAHTCEVTLLAFIDEYRCFISGDFLGLFLDSKPETRNPKPESRKPEPETRNPKPETRNPKSET
jgi:hypothetical protein